MSRLNAFCEVFFQQVENSWQIIDSIFYKDNDSMAQYYRWEYCWCRRERPPQPLRG